VKKLNILLAEDNNIAAMAITLMLEKKFCYVDRAASTQTIWEKYQKDHYDLILINTMLPESSLEVVRKIRKAEAKLNGKMTPIIGIYSDPDRGEKYPYRKYFCVGVNDIYPNPITHHDINSILEKYLL
jgi:CheY-like chemotaxis protein